MIVLRSKPLHHLVTENHFLLLMRVVTVSSLIVINWFKFLGSLHQQKSYSPGLVSYNMLGLQTLTSVQCRIISFVARRAGVTQYSGSIA